MKRYIKLIINLLLFLIIFLALKFYFGRLENPILKLNITNNDFKREKYYVNCDRIFEKNEYEIQKSKLLIRNLNLNANNSFKILPDSTFIFPSSKCEYFKTQRKYSRFNKFTHQIELDYPIAFSILTYENTEQFERLLNTIYRSHNVYCIHIDLKSSQTFKESIKSIAQCFHNVFITTKLEYIIYAGYNRLQADLNCIKDLLDMKNLIKDKHPNLLNKQVIEWKYLLNLASSEFPIKTNFEFVQIVRMLNRSNSIYINKVHSLIKHRMNNIFYNDYLNNDIYPIKKVVNNSPPHSIIVAKGSAYGLFEREFLKNIFTSKKIQDFISWLKFTYSPDEFFWASIELNTHLYENSTFINSNANYIYDIARFNGWHGSYECGGIWRHKICVLSLNDLNRLINERSLIANKFMLGYDPVSYQCLEEWYDKQVQNKFNQNLNDTSFLKDYCSLFKKRSKTIMC